MDKKVVLFDFDGVIADSFSAAFDTSKRIYPFLTVKNYRKRFNGNINSVFSSWRFRLFGRKIDFFNEFIPRLEASPVFPGILDVIEELHKKYKLIVVSSTTSHPIRNYLAKYNAAEYFTDILGNDIHESKVEKIKMVLAKYSSHPNECIFITDTSGDIREAAYVGVKALAVTWGYQKKEALLNGGALALIEKPEDLTEKIDSYFKAQVSTV